MWHTIENSFVHGKSLNHCDIPFIEIRFFDTLLGKASKKKRVFFPFGGGPPPPLESDKNIFYFFGYNVLATPYHESAAPYGVSAALHGVLALQDTHGTSRGA